jgi:hypothetical protein
LERVEGDSMITSIASEAIHLELSGFFSAASSHFLFSDLIIQWSLRELYLVEL